MIMMKMMVMMVTLRGIKQVGSGTHRRLRGPSRTGGGRCAHQDFEDHGNDNIDDDDDDFDDNDADGDCRDASEGRVF